MMLDAREMTVVRCVIEKGSVTAAAAALSVSQPAVSRTLQQVEQRLGIALFRREKQRLFPTREAEMLYGDIVHAVSSIEAVGRRARDLREGRSGALRIASIAAFANSIVPRTVARPRSRASTWRISVPPNSGVCCRAHALAGRPFLAIQEIAAEPLVCLNGILPLGALAHRLFEQNDLALRPVAEVSQSSVACALVEAGAGIALLDKLSILASAASGGLVFVPFRPEESIVGRLVLQAGAAQTAASSAFCIELRELVAEIPASDPGFGLPPPELV